MSHKRKLVDIEKFESKRLFLQAILAEYDKLNEEILNHQKNMVLIFSVMVTGLAALLGVTGVIGILSLLITPIFISFCGVATFMEGFTIGIIGKYIEEEIEQGKLLQLFPNGSPIQWERKFRSQHKSFTDAYGKGIFTISFLGCLVCSITVLLFFWNDLLSNPIYIIMYFAGLVMLGFYTKLAIPLIRS